jgi:hypothetical protein
MYTVILLTVVAGTALVLATLGEDPSPTTADAMKVQKRHEASLMEIPGVVSVGVGEREGKPTIKVFVLEGTPELKGRIPEQLEGVKVDVTPTGPFQALHADANAPE